MSAAPARLSLIKFGNAYIDPLDDITSVKVIELLKADGTTAPNCAMLVLRNVGGLGPISYTAEFADGEGRRLWPILTRSLGS